MALPSVSNEQIELRMKLAAERFGEQGFALLNSCTAQFFERWQEINSAPAIEHPSRAKVHAIFDRFIRTIALPLNQAMDELISVLEPIVPDIRDRLYYWISRMNATSEFPQHKISTVALVGTTGVGKTKLAASLMNATVVVGAKARVLDTRTPIWYIPADPGQKDALRIKIELSSILETLVALIHGHCGEKGFEDVSPEEKTDILEQLSALLGPLHVSRWTDSAQVEHFLRHQVAGDIGIADLRDKMKPFVGKLEDRLDHSLKSLEADSSTGARIQIKETKGQGRVINIAAKNISEKLQETIALFVSNVAAERKRLRLWPVTQAFKCQLHNPFLEQGIQLVDLPGFSRASDVHLLKQNRDLRRAAVWLVVEGYDRACLDQASKRDQELRDCVPDEQRLVAVTHCDMTAALKVSDLLKCEVDDGRYRALSDQLEDLAEELDYLDGPAATRKLSVNMTKMAANFVQNVSDVRKLRELHDAVREKGLMPVAQEQNDILKGINGRDFKDLPPKQLCLLAGHNDIGIQAIRMKLLEKRGRDGAQSIQGELFARWSESSGFLTWLRVATRDVSADVTALQHRTADAVPRVLQELMDTVEAEICIAIGNAFRPGILAARQSISRIITLAPTTTAADFIEGQGLWLEMNDPVARDSSKRLSPIWHRAQRTGYAVVDLVAYASELVAEPLESTQLGRCAIRDVMSTPKFTRAIQDAEHELEEAVRAHSAGNPIILHRVKEACNLADFAGAFEELVSAIVSALKSILVPSSKRTSISSPTGTWEIPRIMAPIWAEYATKTKPNGKYKTERGSYVQGPPQISITPKYKQMLANEDWLPGLSARIADTVGGTTKAWHASTKQSMVGRIRGNVVSGDAVIPIPAHQADQVRAAIDKMHSRREGLNQTFIEIEDMVRALN